MKNTIKSYLLTGLVAVTTLVLTACGGAGAGGTGSGGGAGTGGGGATATVATITLVVEASAGVSTHAVSAGQTVRAIAKFTDATGAGVANAIVKFTTNTDLTDMSPAAGTAITNSSGVATVDITAKAPNAGGAFSVKASVTSGATALSATDWNMSVGAASIVLGGAGGAVTLVPAPTTATPLPAGSTTNISVPVTSGGAPVTSGVTLSFTSPCASQTPPKATITPIGLVNGVYTASYTNNGCATSPDVVTASQVGGTATTSVSIPVAAAALAEIRFVAVNPSGVSLVVRGGGGYGRVENGTVTFKLVDQSGNPVSGATVSFSLSATAGGTNLLSTSAISDTAGLATATIRSGTVPMPVVVVASTTYLGQSLSAASSVINISVGKPEQKNFTFGFDKLNIEGLNIFGITAKASAYMADFWGNKVADGTTVNMISEGGAIGSASSGACLTMDGACSLTFNSQSFTPANGRISVTAYTEGPMSFDDISGTGLTPQPPLNNNVCYHRGDPFIDYDESGTYSDNNGLKNNTTPTSLQGNLLTGNPYPNITLSSLYPNSVESFVSYRGLSGVTNYEAPTAGLACGLVRPLRYIFGQSVIVMSGSVIHGFKPTPTSIPLTWPQTNAAWVQNGYNNGGADPRFNNNCVASIAFTLLASDVNLNPLPKDTTLEVQVAGMKLGTISPDKVGNSNAIGGTAHRIVLTPNDVPTVVAPAPAQPCSANPNGTVIVKATTPLGVISTIVIPVIYQ